MVNIGLFSGMLTLVLNTASAVSLPQHSFLAEKNTAAVVEERKEEAAGPKVKETVRLFVTAYSSSPDETDDTPFITASGKRVADGILATNLFPFGTKARIPALFGDKVFIIEDRMHHRFRDRVDIWMPTKVEALKFGKKSAEIEILE